MFVKTPDYFVLCSGRTDMAGTPDSVIDGAVATELGDRLRAELPYEDEQVMRGCIERLLRRRGLSLADPWTTFSLLIVRTLRRVGPEVTKHRMLEVSKAVRADIHNSDVRT